MASSEAIEYIKQTLGSYKHIFYLSYLIPKFACYMWKGYTTAHRTRVRHMRHARLEAGRVR